MLTESSRQSVCKAAAAIKKQMDEGVYQNNGGVVFGRFGNLATTAPSNPSPLVPGLTDYQAALFVGTNTFLTGNPPAPFWHFVGGQFTDKGSYRMTLFRPHAMDLPVKISATVSASTYGV